MGARRDSSVFHLERLNLNSHLILRSQVAHPLTILEVTTATVSAAYACVSVSECKVFFKSARFCLSVCVSHCVIFLFVILVRTEAEELESERFVWRAICRE